MLLVKMHNRKLTCLIFSVSILLFPSKSIPGQDLNQREIELEFEARLAESSNKDSNTKIQLADWAAKNAPTLP